jgi:hypothetical protein
LSTLLRWLFQVECLDLGTFRLEFLKRMGKEHNPSIAAFLFWFWLFLQGFIAGCDLGDLLAVKAIQIGDIQFPRLSFLFAKRSILKSIQRQYPGLGLAIALSANKADY